MAGKKNRKRKTGSKKKGSKVNKNKGIDVCEEKKPKLDDGSEEQAEQTEKHQQQPNLETTVADANNDVSKDLLQTEESLKENVKERIVVCEEKEPNLDDGLEEQAEQSERQEEQPNLETTVVDTNNDVSKDLQQTEESKYVPPFTGKRKRKLQRDRCSQSISPDVKTTRSKRPWKGSKQNSQQAQQNPADQQTNDETSTKDSPKMSEEEREEVDVVGLIEGVMTCSQENKDVVVFSASKTAADERTVTTDGICSSSPVVTVQEETSAIVMHVIDNIIDAMYNYLNQCNCEEIISEFNREELKESTMEGIDTQMDANIDNEITDSSNQDGVVTEVASEPSLETDTVPTKSATKHLKASSESQTMAITTLQQQQENEATTTQSVEGHDVSSAQETATMEGTLAECNRQVQDPVGELLQNHINFELSQCSLYQNENDNRLKQQRETNNEPCSQNFTITSIDECVCEEAAEPQNPGIECSAVTTPEVNVAVLFKNVMTSIKKEVKKLSPPKVCCECLDSEEECQEQKAGDDLVEAHDLIAEHTGMDHKSNMDTPVLQKEAPNTVDSDICCSDNENYRRPNDSDQDLDQMVPTNCETTTVVFENPGAGESTRKRKRKESDLEDSANACSKPQYSPKVGEREHKDYVLDENMDDNSVVVTGTTTEMNESCQGSSQPLNTAQTLDICMDQEPIISGEITIDQTVTCTKSTCQNQSACKQMTPGKTELVKTVGGKTTENQSSKLEAGCSIFSFDGDIMEFDCLMDCTDSQLVHVDEFSDEKPLPESQKHDARQLNHRGVAGNTCSTNDGNQCSMEVPSDKGMIKGLISELSGLNKFIMGAWKDLENQKKRRQARLKLGKAKKSK
ncbi:uncharacterized protein LOC144663943 isoform X2 [Oculina patagonica]